MAVKLGVNQMKKKAIYLIAPIEDGAISRLLLNKMPRGINGYVLTGKGIDQDPVYEVGGSGQGSHGYFPQGW